MEATPDRVPLEHPAFDVRGLIRASHDANIATVVLTTGAARVQCYATAEQCRALAAMFGALAASIEAPEAEAA